MLIAGYGLKFQDRITDKNPMLLSAIIIILFESIGEGLMKRFNKVSWLFINWVQWLTAFALFASWFLIFALPIHYVPIWKQVLGFVFVRFLIFDPTWNIARGVKWNYYGTTKLYDRIMFELGGVGWMMKIICGIIGVVFLMGWS